LSFSMEGAAPFDIEAMLAKYQGEVNLDAELEELITMSTDRDLTDMEQYDLLCWIDSIDFARKNKTLNMARDFSDGVLMAELISVYLPRSVDLGAFPRANAKSSKLDNWNRLVSTAFRKLGFKLDLQLMEDIVNSKKGAIERALFQLRPLIAAKNPTILNYRIGKAHEPVVEQPRPVIKLKKTWMSKTSRSRKYTAGGTKTKSPAVNDQAEEPSADKPLLNEEEQDDSNNAVEDSHPHLTESVSIEEIWTAGASADRPLVDVSSPLRPADSVFQPQPSGSGTAAANNVENEDSENVPSSSTSSQGRLDEFGDQSLWNIILDDVKAQEEQERRRLGGTKLWHWQ